MSLAILFYFLCAQHVSDINISIIRAYDYSVELPHWSCVLGSMCVGVSVWLGWSGICVGISVWLGWSGIRVEGFSLQHGYHSNPAAPNL